MALFVAFSSILYGYWLLGIVNCFFVELRECCSRGSFEEKKAVKRLWVLGAFMALTVCLTGCNGQTAVREVKSSSWMETGFHAPSQADDGETVWPEEYFEWNLQGITLESPREVIIAQGNAKSWKNKTYRLYRICELPDYAVLRWALVICDADTMQYETKIITHEQLGLVQEDGKKKQGFLIDVEFLDSENFVFQWVENAEDEEGFFRQSADVRIFTDLNGSLSAVDLWDGFEKRQFDAERHAQNLMPPASCVCDERGNLYGVATKGKEKVLWVADSAGNLVMDYRLPPERTPVDCLRTDEGEIVWLFDEGRKQIFSWIDVEKAEVRDVAELSERSRITKLYGMQNGVIYYEDRENGKAYAWDVTTGRRSLFMNYAEGNFSSAFGIAYAFRNEGKPLVRLYRVTDSDGKTEDWLVSVSREKGGNQVNIGLFATDEVGRKVISEAAGLAFQKNPNASCVSQRVSEDEKNRFLNELIAGEAPDVMYVSRGDFLVMASKGLLMDLTELLGESELNGILPGALDLGTVNNHLYGLPVGVNARTYLVANETWGKDTWTIDDMLELFREGKLDGTVYYKNAESPFAPLATIRTLLRFCYHEPWLIDWEAKECHFNGETFIELLSAFKRDEQNDTETMLKQGERFAWAEFNSMSFISDFGIREEWEKGHYVGYPTNGSSGNYLDTAGILVVSAKTTRKDALRDLFECLLDAKVQRNNWCWQKTALPIIKLTKIETTSNGEKTFLDRWEIRNMEDGRTTLEAAEEFLESCVSAPMQETEIENIVFEEVSGFFEGNKSARETAEVIQNRVQLLLYESQ